MNNQDMKDIAQQFMTDEEKYEIEGLDAPEAVKHFIEKFGIDRWQEIAGKSNQ